VNHKRIKDRIPLLLADGPLNTPEEWRNYMRRRRRVVQVPNWLKEDCASKIAVQLKRLEKQLEHNGRTR